MYYFKKNLLAILRESLEKGNQDGTIIKKVSDYLSRDGYEIIDNSYSSSINNQRLKSLIRKEAAIEDLKSGFLDVRGMDIDIKLNTIDTYYAAKGGKCVIEYLGQNITCEMENYHVLKLIL